MLHPTHILTLILASWSFAQDAGALRGRVMDGDFGLPLADARIVVSELERTTQSGSDGNWVLNDVPPGVYTVVVSKTGFIQSLRGDVVVRSGTPSDVNFELMGQFDDQEEFVVEKVETVGGTELGLLELRAESPALLDSISSELISRAGAGDAGAALKLISGATVQDGKYAVVRGLPDRYVNSQLNGIRLPTADADKRAVELDQFPSTVIRTIEVSKTFTPDQQGDASGGAVNMVLKGVPDVTYFSFKASTRWNSQASGRSDFLSYDGGGVGDFGFESDSRTISRVGPYFEGLGGGTPNFNFVVDRPGALGVSTIQSPIQGGFTLAAGGREELSSSIPLIGGGLLGLNTSVFYNRDASYYDDGINDRWSREGLDAGMAPADTQQTAPEEFLTRVYDVTRASQSVNWGGFASLTLELDNTDVALNYLYTRDVNDTAVLATNTRGRDFYLDPAFDGNGDGSPDFPGGVDANPDVSPYVRSEALTYNERYTQTLQLLVTHRLTGWQPNLPGVQWLTPELTFSASSSIASSYTPDSRRLAGIWRDGGTDGNSNGGWTLFQPGANVNFGNLTRTWEDIEETSDQLSLDLSLPFEVDRKRSGAVSAGLFADRTDRTFDNFALSNTGDLGFDNGLDPSDINYEQASQILNGAGFDGSYSDFFENNPYYLRDAQVGADYVGTQAIDAAYLMMDYPLSPTMSATVGARLEQTDLGITVTPQSDFAVYYDYVLGGPIALEPGLADVDFSRSDFLPAASLRWSIKDDISFRSSWSKTIARQTYKELTPLIQQEYLGGPIFIGNQRLGISTLSNLDLRMDWTPYEGGLVSGSWFYKDLTDPIETVQRRQNGFGYTTVTNYDEGTLNGIELEVRQKLGEFNDEWAGLSVGFNATFIDSVVTLPADEAATFDSPVIQAPMSERQMANAPEYLLNLFLNYDNEETGSQFGVYYTRQGTSLVAGATVENDNYIPNIFSVPYDTLNVTFSQRLGRYLTLSLGARNLLNPLIKEVYRSEYIDQQNIIANAYSKGIDFSLSLSTKIEF